MFGLHWALVPLAIMNFAAFQQGTGPGDTILVAMFGTTFAQTGAVIGIMLKTKDQKLKSLCPPAIISGIAGVTEPAIYGVTLPKKAPFFRTCGIAAVAGAVLCAMGVLGTSMAGMGVFGYTAYIDGNGGFGKVVIAIIVSILSTVAGVISELIFYKDSAPKAKEAPKTNADSAKSVELAAPVSGKVISLKEVKDEAFASETLGKGCAIIPSEGVIKAPVDGTISTLPSSMHAVGITTADGSDVLIHVGMNTVELNGKHYSAKVKEGDSVKKGDVLIEFDLAAIKAAGYDTTTPVIICNADDFANIDVVAPSGADVTSGAQLVSASNM